MFSGYLLISINVYRNVLDRQNFKSFHEKRRIFKSLYTSIKRYTCNHFKKHGLHLVNKVQKNGKINISPRKMISALSASLNYQTCSFFYGKHSNWY